MRLAFFGSRELKFEQVLPIIEKEILAMKPDFIVTAAEPKGVCQFAREYAQTKNIPLALHKLDISKAAGKYHHRSVSVYKDCDYVVLIHDGTSHGTANEFELAKKMKVPLTYYSLTVKDVSQESNLPQWYEQLIEFEF